MKIGLPFISGIIIVLVFGLVIAGCLLWRPLKMRWLEGRLDSGTPQERQEAVEKLLAMGEDGKAVVEKQMLGQPMKWVKERFGKYVAKTEDFDRELVELIRKKSKQSDVRFEGKYKAWWYEKIVIDFKKGKVEKVLLRMGKPVPRPKKK